MKPFRTVPKFLVSFARVLVVVAVAGAGISIASAKVVAPTWMTTAAARPHPEYARSVNAEVLYDESINTVAPDGKITTVSRYAVRVLKRAGRDRAIMVAPYDTSYEKILSANAWLVRASGDVKTYAKKDAIDTAFTADALYEESRKLLFSAIEEADAGCIFGYEVTREDRGIHGQANWVFQIDVPVQVSRVTWRVPKGWSVSAMTFNHAAVVPVVTPIETTWELRDLPAIVEEPLGPSRGHLEASLSIDLHPPAANNARPVRRAFQSWSDVSAYLTELQDPPATPEATVTARTRAILAAAGPTQWERIAAIARFAQAVNYVSIQMGVGRGGGYAPHAASEVLRCNYGDCKDKATLMRAMLRVAGIQSFAVGAFSGDRAEVREEWPSPQQFNHCIIAVRVDESVNSPAVVEHPKLGKLFIFDPTDVNTPPGDLDYDAQGSLVLVVGGSDGGLVRLPFLPADTNRFERTINARLSEDGSIAGTIVEKSSGQEAAPERSLFRRMNAPDYRKAIEDWVSGSVNGASVTRVAPEDDATLGKFTLALDFAARAYAQHTMAKLLVLKPAIVSRRGATPLTAARRTQPVILDPRSFTETTEIELPPGFHVDEAITPVEVTTTFGRYSVRCIVTKNVLRYERSLVVNAAELPVEKYAEVKGFYEAMLKAEQTPVVLARE